MQKDYKDHYITWQSTQNSSFTTNGGVLTQSGTLQRPGEIEVLSMVQQNLVLSLMNSDEIKQWLDNAMQHFTSRWERISQIKRTPIEGSTEVLAPYCEWIYDFREKMNVGCIKDFTFSVVQRICHQASVYNPEGSYFQSLEKDSSEKVFWRDMARTFRGCHNLSLLFATHKESDVTKVLLLNYFCTNSWQELAYGEINGTSLRKIFSILQTEHSINIFAEKFPIPLNWSDGGVPSINSSRLVPSTICPERASLLMIPTYITGDSTTTKPNLSSDGLVSALEDLRSNSFKNSRESLFKRILREYDYILSLLDEEEKRDLFTEIDSNTNSGLTVERLWSTGRAVESFFHYLKLVCQEPVFREVLVRSEEGKVRFPDFVDCLSDDTYTEVKIGNATTQIAETIDNIRRLSVPMDSYSLVCLFTDKLSGLDVPVKSLERYLDEHREVFTNEKNYIETLQEVISFLRDYQNLRSPNFEETLELLNNPLDYVILSRMGNSPLVESVETLFMGLNQESMLTACDNSNLLQEVKLLQLALKGDKVALNNIIPDIDTYKYPHHLCYDTTEQRFRNKLLVLPLEAIRAYRDLKLDTAISAVRKIRSNEVWSSEKLTQYIAQFLKPFSELSVEDIRSHENRIALSALAGSMALSLGVISENDLPKKGKELIAQGEISEYEEHLAVMLTKAFSVIRGTSIFFAQRGQEGELHQQLNRLSEFFEFIAIGDGLVEEAIKNSVSLRDYFSNYSKRVDKSLDPMLLQYAFAIKESKISSDINFMLRMSVVKNPYETPMSNVLECTSISMGLLSFGTDVIRLGATKAPKVKQATLQRETASKHREETIRQVEELVDNYFVEIKNLLGDSYKPMLHHLNAEFLSTLLKIPQEAANLRKFEDFWGIVQKTITIDLFGNDPTDFSNSVGEKLRNIEYQRFPTAIEAVGTFLLSHAYIARVVHYMNESDQGRDQKQIYRKKFDFLAFEKSSDGKSYQAYEFTPAIYTAVNLLNIPQGFNINQFIYLACPSFHENSLSFKDLLLGINSLMN
jgi:hypothetical protein